MTIVYFAGHLQLKYIQQLTDVGLFRNERVIFIMLYMFLLPSSGHIEELHKNFSIKDADFFWVRNQWTNGE